MIDASHIKVHSHAAGAHGSNQDMGHTKGGSTPRCSCAWIRIPVRVYIAADPIADCSQACWHIEGIDSEYLWADKHMGAMRMRSCASFDLI